LSETIKKSWYILQVVGSLKEANIISAIEKALEKAKISDAVEEIFVPYKSKIIVVFGKKKEKKVNSMPGYMFVNAEMTDEVWQCLTSVSGVSRVVGSKVAPTPISDEEVLRMKGEIKESRSVVNEEFSVGDNVEVIDGPLRSFMGTVDSVDVAKSKLKLTVYILGRATPVQLSFGQVKKAN